MTSSALQVSSPRLVVLGELASGGMGTVWLAHVEGDPQHLVALKRMHKHLAAEAEFLNMFLDEIWLTGALKHPNIVGLVGWGIDDQGPYFATEFVLGASLSKLNRIGRASQFPLPAELVMHIGAEVARGLHAAYTLPGEDGKLLHIVHRDLTPGNVLVGTDGVVKITDFGVAQAARKIVKTRTGVLKGKLHYMSPEYVRGDQDLDARSDLYSLGVLMFELLAGRRPFGDMREYELLTHIAKHDPPKIQQFVPIDDELAEIVDGLRANDPGGRPANAAEVASHLESLLGDRGFPQGVRRARMCDYVKVHGRAVLEEVAAIRDAAARSEQPLSVLKPEQITRTAESGRSRGGGANEEPSHPRTRAVVATPADESTTRARPRTAEPPPQASAVPTIAVVAAFTIILGFAAGVFAMRWGMESAPVASPSLAPSPAPPANTGSALAQPEPAPTVEPSQQVAATPSSRSSSAQGGGTPAPPSRPPTTAKRPPPAPAPPKRTCTPMDFDYPNCER